MGVLPEMKPGRCVRAREDGGGGTTRRGRSRRLSRRRRTDLGAARLAGRGPTLYVHHVKHAGDFRCGCCWREVVSTPRLACTPRVAGVVEDYDGTCERFKE